jgi:hypothetical protein
MFTSSWAQWRLRIVGVPFLGSVLSVFSVALRVEILNGPAPKLNGPT